MSVFALVALLWGCGTGADSVQPQPPGPAASTAPEVDTASTEIEQPPEPEDSAPPADTGDSLPSDYVFDEDPEEQPPAMERSELEAGLVELFAVLRSVDPVLMHEVYEDLRQDSEDEDCPWYDPNYYDLYDQHYWYDYCTSASGREFAGYGISYYYLDYLSGDYEYDPLAYFYGDGTITSASGSTFSASGYAYSQLYRYLYSDDQYGYAYLSGSYHQAGEEGEGTWLSDSLTLELEQSSWSNPPAGIQQWSLDGSLAYEGQQLVAADFEAFIAMSAAAGTDCPEEPGGAVSVRDAAGNWYDIQFQGAPYAGASVFPLECDGCGEVVLRGEVLYKVCPDFSALTAWEDNPWR